MKPSMDWLEYARLEQIVLPLPQPQRRRWLKPQLTIIWKAFLKSLLKPEKLEIWCTRDSGGHFWWSGYDPITGRSINSVSEGQIRVWMEQRYQ
ncbi:MAG: hypothetical protein F6K42_25380 [Leptolyngbya sp. SIO1D8]|nr:hypothetical protein [Leptolyngbya sp. SIO1D8]